MIISKPNYKDDLSDTSSSGTYPTNLQPKASIWQLAVQIDENAWKNYQGIPKRPIGTLLKCMFEQGINPNLIIVIDDQRYFCHMLVLRAVSTFFRKMPPTTVVKLPGDLVTPRAFVCIYAWALNDKTHLERCVLVEIFSAAKYLEMQRLLELCWACFEDAANNEDQAMLLYQEAKAMRCCIKDLMFTRICRFFLGFVATLEYQQLDVDDVCSLLKRSTIGVNTEMEVFMAAVVWLSYKWPERRPHTKQLLDNVCFSHLPFMFLITFRKRRDSVVIMHMAKSPFIDELLHEGTTHNKTFDSPVRRCTRPEPRLWIYDAKCKYHHVSRCQATLYLTYDSFLDYLEQLQTHGPTHWSTLKNCYDESITCCTKCPAPHFATAPSESLCTQNSSTDIESAIGISDHFRLS